ncbi:hypothetical protein [Catenuloplanes japonicus]|uniref:hypothetical protein n=1 Tax=Catenuloplanes japonicus TaxID=33876 RepID=UPI000A3EC815|nr:hypothetical protein [Catenuloplanes japonicus]
MAGLDLDYLHRAVAPEIFDAAHAVAEELDDLRPHHGGALGTVGQENPVPHRAWAGFVDGSLAGRCDCGAMGAQPDDFCVHIVAVIIAALNEAFRWSPSATFPDTLDDPAAAVPSPAAARSAPGGSPQPETPESAVRRLAGVAATLPPGLLARVVAEHAAADPRLESALLAAAGLPAAHLAKSAR